MLGRSNKPLHELADEVDAADTGERPGMTVKQWDKVNGRYLRASDDAARRMEERKVRQWKR